MSIYKAFGNNAINVIKSNPYVLCESGIDFPFELTETIAFDFGFDKDTESRISAGLQYVLRKNLSNGHSCLPRDKFINVAAKVKKKKQAVFYLCILDFLFCIHLVNTLFRTTDTILRRLYP